MNERKEKNPKLNTKLNLEKKNVFKIKRDETKFEM